MSTIDKYAGKPLRWQDGAIVHAVQTTQAVGGEPMLWTFCRQDVPDGEAVDEDVTVTCPACLHELSVEP
ncbi:hypothetical protein [Emcibacter sp. SYSU 3D8]|uniref:hypothetical protein n=1 Tax=Emcibacter sp. SYSU 3D8 TaxID=3133969 RepID=UPI0031FED401